MNIMTVVANPNLKSSCRAIRFDPVFRTRDFASDIRQSMPPDMPEQMDLMKSIMDFCRVHVQRFVAKRWLKGKSPLELVKIIRGQMSKDVVARQKKLAQAQGLAFIAANYRMNFPAILKGWFERVFAHGFAYSLTPEGRRGASAGRIPLLRHEKALIINTTHFAGRFDSREEARLA